MEMFHLTVPVVRAMADDRLFEFCFSRATELRDLQRRS